VTPHQLAAIIEHAERDRDAARRLCVDLENRITALDARRKASLARRREAAATVTPAFHAEYIAWSQQLMRQEQGFEERMAKAENTLQEARVELTRQHLRVRSLQFLQRRHRERRRAEDRRRSERMGDELAVRQWLEAAS